MNNLSEDATIQFLNTIINLKLKKLTKLFPNINQAYEDRIAKAKHYQHIDSALVVLLIFVFIAGLVLCCCSIPAFTKSRNALGSLEILLGIALIALSVIIVFCGAKWEDRIEKCLSADIIKPLLNQGANCLKELSIDISNLKINFFDTELSKLCTNALAYCQYAYLSGLGEQAENVVQRHPKINVLMDGIQTASSLDENADQTEDFYQLKQALKDEISKFNKDIAMTIAPSVNRIMLKMIQTKQTHLLPDEARQNVSKDFIKQLLTSVESDNN